MEPLAELRRALAARAGLELDHAGIECCRLAAAVEVRKDVTEDLWAEFEKSCVRQLGRAWTRAAKRGLKDGLAAAEDAGHSKRAAGRVTAAVVQHTDTWFDDNTFFDGAVPILYTALARQFLRDFVVEKAKASGKGARIKANLSKKDKDAIDAIRRISEQAAGSLFPADVASKVQQVVEHIVLNEGLPVSEAAARLRSELEGALGLVKTSEVVPSSFATNPGAYFKVLAQNAAGLATNMGRVVTMADAGVKAYEVVAVIDARTSKICRAMNGRIIAVDSGVAMVDAIIEAGTATGLKDAFPWDSSRTAKDLGPNTPANNAKLAASGLGFPPYHGECRSFVVPVI